MTACGTCHAVLHMHMRITTSVGIILIRTYSSNLQLRIMTSHQGADAGTTGTLN
jgi:hypothetical protein